MSHRHLTRSAALSLAAAAALAAPATAAATDQAERALHLRSQALNERYVLTETTDPAERALQLRSQALNDRYASSRSALTPAKVLPSPDARDAAVGRDTLGAPQVTILKVPGTSSPVSSPTRTGIDWLDAGFGALGTLFGLGLVSLTAYTIVHRRRADPARRETATVA